MNIRNIRKEDNPILAKIVRNCFEEFEVPTKGTVYEDPTTDDLFTLFQAKGSFLLVADEDGQLLGCCGIYPTDGLPEGCAEMVKFYLAPAARGKGIGKALVEQSIEKAKGLGYKEIYIETVPQFTTAIAMYEKMNFRYLDKPMGNSGHCGCPVWMAKTI